MTRLHIPPPSTQAINQSATLAQSVRTKSASSTPERTEFRDALAEADERASGQAPEKSEQAQPDPSDETRAREDQPGEKPEPEAKDQADESGDEPENQTPEAPAVQESLQDESSEPLEPAGEVIEAQNVEHEAEAQAGIDPGAAELADSREQGTQDQDEPVVPLDATPPSEPRVPDQQTSTPESRQAETPNPPPQNTQASTEPMPERGVPGQSESDRQFRAQNAPRGEDRAKESIDVATRFDAAIRDQIRHAARIDLAALAAEKLASPTERAHAEPASSPIFDRYPIGPERAQAQDEPRSAQPRPPAQTQSPPPPLREQSLSGPFSQVRGDTPATLRTTIQPAPLVAQTSSATGTQAPTQSGAPLHPAFVGAAPSGSQAPNATPARSFDRAISALRSLGAGQTPGRAKASAGSRAGPNTPAARAESGRPMLAQVSRGVASILRQQGGSLTIRLRPDSLGELKINLRVQNGGVEAVFKVNNAQARDLLESTLSQLKDTLESSGVRVDRLRVELDNARTQDAAAPRAEYRGHEGDGSPGFDDPSETDGREGDSRSGRHGSRGQPHGRGLPDGPGDDGAPDGRPPNPTTGLDAEAERDNVWIGVDTLA